MFNPKEIKAQEKLIQDLPEFQSVDNVMKLLSDTLDSLIIQVGPENVSAGILTYSTYLRRVVMDLSDIDHEKVLMISKKTKKDMLANLTGLSKIINEARNKMN